MPTPFFATSPGNLRDAEQVKAVRFLAADPAAAYIAGQVLQVDGGMVMA